MSTIIQFRRDSTAGWEANKTKIPDEAEPCVNLETGELRIGNGVDPYEALKPVGAIPAEILDVLRSLQENKVDKAEGSRLMTDAEGAKLAGIAEGAQKNVIESVEIAGKLASVTDRKVSIPLASAGTTGVVQGKSGENCVEVAADGSMKVHSLNVDKLLQTEGNTIIFNGGTSSTVI